MFSVTRFATNDHDRSGRAGRHPYWRVALLACGLLLMNAAALGQQSQAPSSTVDQQAIEQQKIAYLIDAVASLKDARFIRNGSSHDAAQAAAHMRLKLRFAGSRVKTAEEFITCCATGSSVSGLPYTIRFADGRTVESATYLRAKLAAYPSTAAQASH